MDFSVINDNIEFLMLGLMRSFQLAIFTIVLSLTIACFIAIGRVSSKRSIRYPSAIFVNLLRSNPLILIVFWFFFLVPLITGKTLPEFHTVLIAFVVFFAAYFAEIVRSGIQSVGSAQVKAALSTGLTYSQSMRLIVLPQALRNMLPALVTECVIVFQGTTIAYVIGMREFLHSTSLVAERTVRPVELYLFAALVYLVICFTGTRLALFLEKNKELAR
ncbi:amino acid ABC transporter permease [Alphaproteobacteria bacterium LSUCC0396]|tara:strand:+ start:5376 stop:6029 length:654 start_codon:yes stop_codon:yes gene_type:complete